MVCNSKLAYIFLCGCFLLIFLKKKSCLCSALIHVMPHAYLCPCRELQNDDPIRPTLKFAPCRLIACRVVLKLKRGVPVPCSCWSGPFNTSTTKCCPNTFIKHTFCGVHTHSIELYNNMY